MYYSDFIENFNYQIDNEYDCDSLKEIKKILEVYL